jgi:hypothetical protein
MRAMNDIERLFSGNRPVPGLRRTRNGGRMKGGAAAAKATIEDLQPTVTPIHLVEPAPVAEVDVDAETHFAAETRYAAETHYAVDADAVSGRAVEGQHLVDADAYAEMPHASTSGSTTCVACGISA